MMDENAIKLLGTDLIEQGLLIPHLSIGKLGDFERLEVERAVVHCQHAHVFIRQDRVIHFFDFLLQ